jgi:hypothetical protein
MRDSASDQPTIMETLAVYVRQHAPRDLESLPRQAESQVGHPHRLAVATRDVVDSRRVGLIMKETSGRSGGA